MEKFERSLLCGRKICADCKKEFYGWGYVKGYTHPAKDLLEETFCANEITICYSCYKKYKEEEGK